MKSVTSGRRPTAGMSVRLRESPLDPAARQMNTPDAKDLYERFVPWTR